MLPLNLVAIKNCFHGSRPTLFIVSMKRQIVVQKNMTPTQTATTCVKVPAGRQAAGQTPIGVQLLHTQTCGPNKMMDFLPNKNWMVMSEICSACLSFIIIEEWNHKKTAMQQDVRLIPPQFQPTQDLFFFSYGKKNQIIQIILFEFFKHTCGRRNTCASTGSNHIFGNFVERFWKEPSTGYTLVKQTEKRQDETRNKLSKIVCQ